MCCKYVCQAINLNYFKRGIEVSVYASLFLCIFSITLQVLHQAYLIAQPSRIYLACFDCKEKSRGNLE